MLRLATHFRRCRWGILGDRHLKQLARELDKSSYRTVEGAPACEFSDDDGGCVVHGPHGVVVAEDFWEVTVSFVARDFWEVTASFVARDFWQVTGLLAAEGFREATGSLVSSGDVQLDPQKDGHGECGSFARVE